MPVTGDTVLYLGEYAPSNHVENGLLNEEFILTMANAGPLQFLSLHGLYLHEEAWEGLTMKEKSLSLGRQVLVL
jgi:hypothetical protein